MFLQPVEHHDSEWDVPPRAWAYESERSTPV